MKKKRVVKGGPGPKKLSTKFDYLGHFKTGKAKSIHVAQ